jgi:hypothetical protein
MMTTTCEAKSKKNSKVRITTTLLYLHLFFYLCLYVPFHLCLPHHHDDQL